MGVIKIIGIFLMIIVIVSLFLHFQSQQKNLKEMFIGNVPDAYKDVIQRMVREIKQRDPTTEEVRKLRKKMQNPNDQRAILEHFEGDKGDKGEKEGEDDPETINSMLQNHDGTSNTDIVKQLFQTHLLREPTKREMKSYTRILEEEDGDIGKVVLKIKRTREYRELNKHESDDSVRPQNDDGINFARVMPHPKDNKKKRQRFQDTLESVPKEKKANIYQIIVQTYDAVLRRLPTMYELDYYASKWIKTESFRVDELRRILQSSKEYEMLVRAQSNVVRSEMPMNISEQQLNYEVRDIYERVQKNNPDLKFHQKETAMGADEDRNMDGSLFSFLKKKYIEYELDEEKLERLITLFLRFETGMQEKEKKDDERKKKDKSQKNTYDQEEADIDEEDPEDNSMLGDWIPDSWVPSWSSSKDKDPQKDKSQKKNRPQEQDEEDTIGITADMMNAENAHPVSTLDDAEEINQPSVRQDPFSRLHECLQFDYSRRNAIAHLQNERNKAELEMLLDRQKKLGKQEQEKVNNYMHRQFKPVVYEPSSTTEYGKSASLDEAFGTATHPT